MGPSQHTAKGPTIGEVEAVERLARGLLDGPKRRDGKSESSASHGLDVTREPQVLHLYDRGCSLPGRYGRAQRGVVLRLP